MLVSISFENLMNGYRLTVDGKRVPVPIELFTSAVVGSINVLSDPSLAQEVQVSIENDTARLDGVELDKGASRRISIYEFHNKPIEKPIE